MLTNHSSNCIFYIVRHGETEWNVKGLVQGWGDSPLTKLGEEQARQLALTLSPIQLDLVFSSDLLRAKKTAEIIVADGKVSVDTSAQLKEQCFGSCEGMKREDFLQLFIGWKELSLEEKFNYKVGKGAESDNEAVSRVIKFLKEIAKDNPDKTILIVTHGGIMRYLLIKLGWAAYETLERVSNAAYIKLCSNGKTFDIEETVGITKKSVFP